MAATQYYSEYSSNNNDFYGANYSNSQQYNYHSNSYGNSTVS